MGTYKILKNLRPNEDYAELLRDVASKIAKLEEPIDPKMIEQIKELSESTIKQGQEEERQKENKRIKFCVDGLKFAYKNKNIER